MTRGHARTLAIALAAAAQPGLPAGAGKGGHFLRALKGGLATVGVTDDQKATITAILDLLREREELEARDAGEEVHPERAVRSSAYSPRCAAISRRCAKRRRARRCWPS